MKNYFPPINQSYTYLQTNRSNILGSLWSTFNIDLQSNLGAIRLAQKLAINTASTDDSDLGTASAFEYWKGVWWAICDTTIFSSASIDPGSAFTEDAGTGAVKTYDFRVSDLAVFDDRLWSTADTALYSRVNTTWTSRDTLTMGVVHKLAYFKKYDRLYYSNAADTICSINAANTVADPGADYAIDLNESIGAITTMVTTSDFVWIGTIKSQTGTTENGTVGSIVAWDGISAQITSDKQFIVAGCLAMIVLNDVPYALDSEGRLLKFTGYSFEEVGRLPVDRTLLLAATLGAVGISNGRFTHFNGMIGTKNNTILVSVKNSNAILLDITENLPSGVWEFDLSTGNVTHKYSFGLKTIGSATITDFGQNRVSSVGALKANTFALSAAQTGGRSTLLVGATIFTTATVTKSAIFNDSPASPTTDVEGQKRGYFVTTWFNSQKIKERWDDVWAVYRRFLNSADKITFKYRFTEETPVAATITWVDTTHFTTTTDVSAYSPTATGFTGTYGGEVEIIQGVGSGACVHITSVVNNAGTYTVTIDNAVTGATTTTAIARFQKWIKMLPEITGQVDQYAQVQIKDNDVRVQIKCVLEFTGNDEFLKFILSSEDDIKGD